MSIKELLKLVAETIEYEGELELDQKIEDIEEWDSLGVLSIVSMLDTMKIKVDLEELSEISTVEDFVKLAGIDNE